MDIYKKAALQNLTFRTPRGLYAIADLKSLGLAVMDKMAIDLLDSYTATTTTFLSKKVKMSAAEKSDRLRVAILIDLIGDMESEAAKRDARREAKKEYDSLLAVSESNKEAELKGLKQSTVKSRIKKLKKAHSFS